MNTLCIDIGNSRIKVGYFENSQFQSGITFGHGDDYFTMKITFEQWLMDKEVKHVGICNVGTNDTERYNFLYDYADLVVWQMGAGLKLPFRMGYQTPSSLGSDRLCAVVGALKQISSPPLLVIDVGTAITYDLLNEHNVYLGGAISPGMSLKFQALHQYTAKLPLVSFEENYPFVGRNTEQSIRTGVQSSTLAEIEGMVMRYKGLSPNLTVFLTGGDAHFLQKYTTCFDYHDPYLVLKGIDALIYFQLYEQLP